MRIFGRGGGKRRPPEKLPEGSFSVDRAGNILASTLPQTFPAADTRAISQLVLSLFRFAPKYGVPLFELRVRYEGLTVTARELRGGAIVFLSPRDIGNSDRTTYGK
jgi:hypothetical protein